MIFPSQKYSYSPPQVFGFSRYNSTTNGGVVVTMTGLNFGPPTGASNVTIFTSPCLPGALFDRTQ